jgi:hypothetical protein
VTAFDALQRTPEFFRRYLIRHLTHADLGAKSALADTQSHVFNDANFVNLWNGLLPADRELLRLIVAGIVRGNGAVDVLGPAPYSKSKPKI